MLARSGADELLFKTRDEPGRAEHDLAVLAARAGDRLVADFAVDIDNQDVFVLGRPLDGFGFALLLGDPLDRSLDVFLRHLDNQPLDVEIAKIGLRDLREDLDQHLVFEIGPLAERDDVEFWRQRRAQIVLADRIGRAALDRALQHFAKHRGAITPTQD